MKKIFNIILIVVLFTVLGFLLWKNTSVSSGYYFNKGKKLFETQNYVQASKMFEMAYSKSPKNELYQYFYVAALSKLEPDYDIEETLYNLAHTEDDSLAKEYAKSSIFALRKKLLEDFEDNYILNAISNKDVIHWNIQDFPLKVYIQPSGDIPQHYSDNISNALYEWEKRTGFITFKIVDNPHDSNINIFFNDVSGSDCADNDCQFVAATTEPFISPDNKLEKMTISFNKTNPLGQEFTDKEIYHTALHEFGHALGIIGHSDNNSDIMFSDNHQIYGIFAEHRSNSISMRDLKTLALLYKIFPNITNSDIKNKNDYIFAPVILGDEEQILQNKLEELERYIKNYPDVANGYINISGVYSQMGENEKALESLDTAENYVKSKDETFIIEYNRAVIYFNSQKFDDAKIHIQKALNIKDDPNLRSMQEEINKISKF